MADRSYNEYGLPGWLKESINAFVNNTNKMITDCLYCELQSDINVAEVEQLITSEQAWYLREKYLGLSRKGDFDD